MTVIIPESELPLELTSEQAVEAAYAGALARIAGDVERRLPVLIECDKELAAFLYVSLRNRLQPLGRKCVFLDGRPRETTPQRDGDFLANTLQQLRDTVRGAVEHKVVLLPHLDLLTTSQGGLTTEAKEVITLLYENPELVWVGFKDPSFPLPAVIENLFPRRHAILGIVRDRLRCLITQSEARKLGRGFNPWLLYKYVSGVNAVRLRQLLAALDGLDYPADPAEALEQIRRATTTGTLEVPTTDLDRDIGGYPEVKSRLRSELLDILTWKDQQTDPLQIAHLEKLLPRGMIFWGPPGTGKTLFAKALASSIGAAITVVSGPELKSRWVGESEENLRRIFHRARQSAPAIIVFDELDSFASARGTYTGSGVEHSMVNQLLTEMDGFRSDELVFVVGTTNLVDALDPALLRPGRFEFLLHIPFPVEDDRREILKIHAGNLDLNLPEATLEHAVQRTGDSVRIAGRDMRFTGDHLYALCRGMARQHIRGEPGRALTADDIGVVLEQWAD